MSLDNVLNAAESSAQTDPSPIRPPDSINESEVRPLPELIEPSPPSDEVLVSREYLEQLLSRHADEVLDRFHGRFEGRRLGKGRLARRNADEVATRILDRIQRRLAKAGGEREEGEDLRALARELSGSLRKSFRDAFALLRKLGVLGHERGAGALDDIHQALGHGIERLERLEDGEQPTAVRLDREIEVSRSRQFELEVTTREGDVVTLQIASQARRSSSLSFSAGPDSVSLRRQQEMSFEQQLSLRVQGELNDDERAAIEDLVSRVGGLSNAFYRGNLGAVSEQAGKLDGRGDQIAGLTLGLEQTYERRVAVAYREVANLGSEEAAEDRPEALSSLTDFLRERRGLYELPLLRGMFGDTSALVDQLLAGALRTHPDGEASEAAA